MGTIHLVQEDQERLSVLLHDATRTARWVHVQVGILVGNPGGVGDDLGIQRLDLVLQRLHFGFQFYNLRIVNGCHGTTLNQVVKTVLGLL